MIEILTPWTTQLIFCFILNHIFYYVLNKFRCQNGFLSISIRLIYAIFLITVLLSFNAEILFIKLCIIDLLGEEIQFDPQKLPSEFFWSFETSLVKMDDQQLILYFGRTKKGIDQLQETVEQAQTILRHLFSGWILSLDITEADSKYQFKDDCFFVNFNYTNTLEKRFKVPKSSIYHIHGDAEHPDSIIFGHATHPETAFTELTEQHFIKPLIPGHGLPRLKALYAIEDALYRTDKHVGDNINHMCAAFMDANLHIEDIENIYVLGHSFGDPDAEYFDYIDKTTRCGCDFEALSAAGKMVEDDFMQLLMLTGTNVLSMPLGISKMMDPAQHPVRGAP